METSCLEKSHSENNDCNICYETPCDLSYIVKLECCNNTKQICMNCLNCLTTPICPYCRKELNEKYLPYLSSSFSNSAISRSENIVNTNYSSYSWERFLYEENIINPYLFDDSRRLRRQIRRLRYEYQQRQSQYRNQAYMPSRRQRRQTYNDRRELNNYTRNMTQLANQTNNDYIDDGNDLLFSFEE